MHSLGVKRTCIFAWKQKIEFCLTGFFIIGIEDEANALQFFIYTIFCFFFWFYFETKHLTLKYVLNSDRCNKNRNGKCFFLVFVYLAIERYIPLCHGMDKLVLHFLTLTFLRLPILPLVVRFFFLRTAKHI